MTTRVFAFAVILMATTTNHIFSQGSLYRSGDIVRISETDTLGRQLVATGERIEISGVLQNDLVAAGSHVSVNGHIGDDAVLAGDFLTFTGTIGDMMMAAAGTLLIDGTIGGDLFTAGRSVRFTENSTIGGRAFIAGDEISIEEASSVRGQSRIAGKTVFLNGRFEDHVVIYSSTITFGPQYYSSGETTIISNTPVYRENLGTIPERLIIDIRRPPLLPVIMFQTWYYLGLLVIGFVLLWLFLPAVKDLQQFAIERFWKNTGIGVLVFLLVPLALFLLLFPVITIPLAILTGMIYLLILFLSYLLVAAILGLQFILWFKKTTSKSTWYWSLVLGLIIIAVVNNLPILGILFSLFLLFFGVGSLTSYLVVRYRQRALPDA